MVANRKGGRKEDLQMGTMENRQKGRDVSTECQRTRTRSLDDGIAFAPSIPFQMLILASYPSVQQSVASH